MRLGARDVALEVARDPPTTANTRRAADVAAGRPASWRCGASRHGAGSRAAGRWRRETSSTAAGTAATWRGLVRRLGRDFAPARAWDRARRASRAVASGWTWSTAVADHQRRHRERGGLAPASRPGRRRRCRASRSAVTAGSGRSKKPSSEARLSGASRASMRGGRRMPRTAAPRLAGGDARAAAAATSA